MSRISRPPATTPSWRSRWSRWRLGRPDRSGSGRTMSSGPRSSGGAVGDLVAGSSAVERAARTSAWLATGELMAHGAASRSRSSPWSYRSRQRLPAEAFNAAAAAAIVCEMLVAVDPSGAQVQYSSMLQNPSPACSAARTHVPSQQGRAAAPRRSCSSSTVPVHGK